MATFTYESIKNRFKNPTVDGNLDLLDDGGIIKVGADDDLQITHSGSAATVTNSTGDTTLDLAGDLIIDVDGADIALKDNGTQFGGFSNSSGHLQIKDGTTTFLTGNGNDATFADTLAVTGVLTADAGVNIDNITIDGTEIDLSSGDLTVDVAGDIILDADGGDVFVKDAGTTYGSLTNSSGNLIIKSGTTTAATFSGANVTFAGTVTGTLISAYPVGSIYMNASSSANPASLLGFGTWSAFGTGRMLIGIDSSDSDFNTVEETGGSKTHTIAQTNLPDITLQTTESVKIEESPSNKGSSSGSGAAYNKADVPLGGDGTAINHMPPFIAVYMWKRTA